VAIVSSTVLKYCTIRDLSDGGARLEFLGAPELPPAFVVKSLLTGAAAPVLLIWQRGSAAGVRFAFPAPGSQTG
jgi:hypothetical protein